MFKTQCNNSINRITFASLAGGLGISLHVIKNARITKVHGMFGKTTTSSVEWKSENFERNVNCIAMISQYKRACNTHLIIYILR